MIRLFKVYYPVRTLILLTGEALVIWTSFWLGTVLQFREDSFLVLNFEYGYLKILLVTAFVLVCSHWFDLYDTTRVNARGELYFRLLMVPGLLALALAGTERLFPRVTPGNGAFLMGLIILTFALVLWRTGYTWLAQQPYLRERVYVLGTGARAQRLVTGLRNRLDLGISVVGWTGDLGPNASREDAANHILEMSGRRLHRVIVAMPDRRGSLPVQELLKLRLEGVKVEDATSWLEKISGRIEIDNLYPSWIIFAEGFRFNAGSMVLRRMISLSVSLFGLVLALPVIPFVILAIKLDSPGPVLYRQRRVGRNGVCFYISKFRTMRQDAESVTGPTWAGQNDPRVTKVGKFLRTSRLDEIPQLWNVLRGDMGFIGPRPERPEFVEWLTKEIPYYGVRHVIRPGVTGWAQVRYKYGNTVEDAKEKLQYDLFYIKNMSLGLDLLIIFDTIKIVVLGRGAH
ncbi:MAG: TIGR03013 family PEP-CTERM/XrtA system glycosyltransferase [Acidobacteria bacterium]|nr:TIGR03013 family PEP-CTERM/XrtA system glycosyltransferase [Acidobacteriota bacterium]